MNLEIQIMMNPTRFMPKGIVLQGSEVGNFPSFLAYKMKEAGLDADSPDEAIAPIVQSAAEEIVSIRTMRHTTYRVPKHLDHKYRGCGNGVVVIDKAKNEVVDFDYTDSKLRPLTEQNITMSKSAGKKVREDDKTVTYRANFSSYTICLF